MAFRSAGFRSSFNGAAIRRRRRERKPFLQKKAGPGLQRSRHPKTAESDRDDGGRTAFEGASTEPPSEDGGEQRAVVVTDTTIDVLQRSRHPKTAESPRVPARARRRSGASTEPPSEDGGEVLVGFNIGARHRVLQRSRHPKTAERAGLHRRGAR